MKPQLSACAFSLLSKGEHIRCIYPEVASNARQWAIRDTTSSGVRVITDRSHDACSARALSSIPLVFAASVWSRLIGFDERLDKTTHRISTETDNKERRRSPPRGKRPRERTE